MAFRNINPLYTEILMAEKIDHSFNKYLLSMHYDRAYFRH